MVTEGLPVRLNDRREDLLVRGRTTRFGVLFATGLLSALTGLVRSSHLAGAALQVLLCGAAFGVAATMVTGARLRTLRGLSRTERVAVARAIRRGTAPDDPRLARATLEHIAYLRRSGTTGAPMILLMFLAFALLVVALATRQPLVLAAEGGVVGAWHSLLPPLRAGRRDEAWSRLHFSERQARETLGLPPVRAPRPIVSTGRAFAIAGVVVVATVVLGAQAFDFLSGLPRSAPAEIDRNPTAAGYTRIGTSHGTTVWARHDRAADILWVKTTGAVEEACRIDPEPTMDGTVPQWPFTDLCEFDDRRHGSVLAFFAADGSDPEAVRFDNGAFEARADVDIDLSTRGAPGMTLVVYILQGADVSGHRVTAPG